MKHRTVHECERCGHQELVNRSGQRFTDDDYIELLHEFMALQRECKLWRALHRSAVQRLNYKTVEATEPEASTVPF